jgi:hypothetical protein
LAIIAGTACDVGDPVTRARESVNLGVAFLLMHHPGGWRRKIHREGSARSEPESAEEHE